jgi:hypothetical protein
MSTHDRGSQHAPDTSELERSARRIRWTERALIPLAFAAGWCVSDYLGWFR